MCNILCQGDEHAIVVGSWIPDIEFLRATDVGDTFTFSLEGDPTYTGHHGLEDGSTLRILAIDPAPEGVIPESQVQEGYVYPFLVTIELLKELTS